MLRVLRKPMLIIEAIELIQWKGTCIFYIQSDPSKIQIQGLS